MNQTIITIILNIFTWKIIFEKLNNWKSANNMLFRSSSFSNRHFRNPIIEHFDLWNQWFVVCQYLSFPFLIHAWMIRIKKTKILSFFCLVFWEQWRFIDLSFNLSVAITENFLEIISTTAFNRNSKIRCYTQSDPLNRAGFFLFFIFKTSRRRGRKMKKNLYILPILFFVFLFSCVYK